MMQVFRMVAAASLIVACGPESEPQNAPSEQALRYAAAVCEAGSTCGCVDRFGDLEVCKTVMASRFDEAVEDDEVSAAALDAALEDPCSTYFEFTPGEPVVVGTKTIDESCDPHDDLPLVDVEECAADLRCFYGTCTDEPGVPTAAEGDACDPRVNGACGLSFYCGTDEVCHPRRGIGEACDSAGGCVGGTVQAHCRGLASGSGVCAARSGLGEACDPLDASPCETVMVEEYMREGYCEPASKICVETAAPRLCADSNRPVAWPGD